MAASSVSREWLAWIGRVARGDAGATVDALNPARPDADRFACQLEEQPSLLVPRRSLPAVSAGDAAAEPSAGKWNWNPQCILCEPGQLPAALQGTEEWREGFAFGDDQTVWVRDETCDQWRPFWLGNALAAKVRGAQRSASPADEFEANEREILVNAGMLVSEGQSAIGKKQRDEATEQAQEAFRRQGYCAVDGLVHPYHVGELRRYYRRMIRRGRVTLGDFQSPRRYVAHNEAVARFFHLQLTGAVERLVGEQVKPSYVYFASYLAGAQLPRHTDREECEFSITFCLDYAPEPANTTPWPLQLDTSHGRVMVEQALGDALLYRGRKLPHYRDRLPDGHTSSSIFFHYVRPDFSGSLS
jgi:hypothetical protein